MTNTNSIGPRPSDPSAISFDRACFAKVGTRTEYTVTQSALHSGPKHFADRAAAAAFAARAGRPVNEHQVDVMVRISWTAP